MNSDKIIVFREGKVLEIGKHEDLMKKTPGFYKELVEG